MGLRLLILMLASISLNAGSLHSYVDENGIRVFTNIGVRRIDRSPSPRFTRPSSRAPLEYLALIHESADKFGIDPDLVHAIVEVESNYDARAVSPKGCIGLMQLHPDTARRFGVQDVFDARENILGGVKYIDFLMRYFDGHLPHVLAAYNAGENAVRRYNGIPPYRETQNYVRKVTSIYRSLRPATPPEPTYKPLKRMVLPNGSILWTNTG